MAKALVTIGATSQEVNIKASTATALLHLPSGLHAAEGRLDAALFGVLPPQSAHACADALTRRHAPR